MVQATDVIKLTGKGGDVYILRDDIRRVVQQHGDTLVVLASGKHEFVKESASAVHGAWVGGVTQMREVAA